VINLVEHKQEKEAEKHKDKKKQKKDPKDVKIEELTELVKRVQAEFENFKKREEKDRKQFVEYSNAELISNLLPVLDSVQAAENTEEAKKLIQPIKTQLTQVLEKYGLKEIEALGKKFNPELHDCLMQENDSEKENNIVLEELQKGYTLKDKVLRHARVKINRKKTEEKQPFLEKKVATQTKGLSAQQNQDFVSEQKKGEEK